MGLVWFTTTAAEGEGATVHGGDVMEMNGAAILTQPPYPPPPPPPFNRHTHQTHPPLYNNLTHSTDDMACRGHSAGMAW